MMTYHECIPLINQLNHADKLRLAQWLIRQIALDEGIPDVNQIENTNPDSVVFSKIHVNLILSNVGEVSSTIDNISLTGNDAADFSLESWLCNFISILYPGVQCSINVWFKPTSSGQKQAQLTVTAGNSSIKALLTGIAEEPQDCSDTNITIESIQTGRWDTASTWSTATTPTDVVRINNGHTITDQELAKIKTLCVQAGATLESLNDQGTALEIQATDYLENKGFIRGKDGLHETQSACTQANLGTEGCAQQDFAQRLAYCRWQILW